MFSRKTDKYNRVVSNVIYEGGDEKKDEDLTTLQQLAMIADRSMWPIVGSLFHPTYMLVNAKVLGGMDPDAALCGNDAT